MSEPIKYVICDCNNRYEAYDKQEVLAVLQQAIDNQSLAGIDSDAGFVTKIKEQNANKALHIWYGTQAEFNALATKAEDTIYIFTDDETIQDIDADLNELEALVNANISAISNIVSGTTPVGRATAATTADGMKKTVIYNNPTGVAFGNNITATEALQEGYRYLILTNDNTVLEGIFINNYLQAQNVYNISFDNTLVKTLSIILGCINTTVTLTGTITCMSKLEDVKSYDIIAATNKVVKIIKLDKVI